MQSNRATIVTDLGFGDAGKGTIVDFLARQGRVSAVVRYNGGAQAAHNVVTPDGRHHTFSQFGSGTFVPGVRTHLTRFVLVDPFALGSELQNLYSMGVKTASSRLTVDENALVVTPFHKVANRIREHLRGDKCHGTCGMGIGETMAIALAHPELVIRVKDLHDLASLRKKMSALQEILYQELGPHFHDLPGEELPRDLDVLNSAESLQLNAHGLWQYAKMLTVVGSEYLQTLAKQGNLIFEGAQGVLLDEWHGFHPYTTWSTTTPANALTLLREIGYENPITKLGVLRTYAVRHGLGPFPTEDDSIRIMEASNGDHGLQGKFRRGWFDLVLSKYAIDVCGGIDSLAITHADRFSHVDEWKICSAYRYEGTELDRIKPKRVLTDQGWQEDLTRQLFRAEPLYQKPPPSDKNDPTKYLGMLEDSLGIQIGLTSWGPTAGDKRTREKQSIAT